MPSSNTVTLGCVGCGSPCLIVGPCAGCRMHAVSLLAIDEGSLHRIAGCEGALALREEGNAAWCAVCLPSLTSAEACAASLQSTPIPLTRHFCNFATVASEAALCRIDLHAPDLDCSLNAKLSSAERFGHLRVCMEPDWQAFGCSRASASEDLIQLAERLGCRDRSQPPLPQQWAVCLARGAEAVQAALHLAGGAQTLTLADPAAAICLCYGIVQAVGDLRHSWLPTDVRERAERACALLGPDMLRHATEDLKKGIRGGAQRAYAAARLAHAFVTCTRPSVQGDVPDQAVVQFLTDANKVRRQVFVCT